MSWSEVLQSRLPRRQRECGNGHRFWTAETYEDDTVTMLTADELAARWRMNARTLANWRTAGKGPAYVKLGEGRQTRVLYREEDVLAFERAGVKQAKEAA